jgi:hypothetical protein
MEETAAPLYDNNRQIAARQSTGLSVVYTIKQQLFLRWASHLFSGFLRC